MLMVAKENIQSINVDTVMMNEYAPIIIFAFNRLEPLKKTVASVLRNTESADSDLFVFVDGARENKDGEKEKVKAVQDFVKSIFGFKSVTYRFAEENRGLGPSIIAGVSEVINKHGRAIVLEDDLILAQNALSFLNQGLEKYQNEQKVFSVCAYTSKVARPKDYTADSYFCTRSSSWGWATWADRWNSVDWELNDFEQYKSKASAFNKWGGSDCWHMLKQWHDGGNKSWAIRFCFAQFLQDKVSLFPMLSKVNNEGFEGDGTNCKKYSRFKFEFDESDEKTFVFPDNVCINMVIYKSAMSYHTIFKRGISRIMYLIYR